MAAQDLGKIVRDMYEAWNAKDMDRCASYAHSDAKMTNVPFGSKHGFREYVEGWANAFPDGKIQITKCVVQGDDVVCEFTGRGTHTGTLKGPAGDLGPTNRRLELQVVDSFRFRDGRIVEGRCYYDAFSLFKQLGIGAPQERATTTGTQAGQY
jgi:predicted ester cyclase